MRLLWGGGSNWILVAAAFLLAASTLYADNSMPTILQGVNIEQKLGMLVPTDLSFTNEMGEAVTLEQLLDGKPAVLNLVYYECPMLCTQVLNGLISSLRPLNFTPGNEFQIITVSFDPDETPELAQAKKKAYLQEYGRPDAEAGWHFLTGSEESIRRLTDAVGFRYSYDPEIDQYAHASGIMVLTPEGRLARYFYGIEYSTRDLRLALVEASENRIGNPVDQFLLFCFHYDPTTGKYSAYALNLIRLGGIITVLGLSIFIIAMKKKERKNNSV